MIAALPPAKDFLDPCTDRAQRAVVRFERGGSQPAVAFAHQPRGSALRCDRLFDRERVVGFIAIDLARLIRNDRRGDIDIGLVGRSDCDIADEFHCPYRRQHAPYSHVPARGFCASPKPRLYRLCWPSR